MLSYKKRTMFGIIMAGLLLVACQEKDTQPQVSTDHAAKDYWYDGKAEISSYDLKQARYGEIHTGSAVTVFVTETFSKDSWAKADNPSDKDIPVMKLNFTKNFNTGIYPYSMMNSTFFPFDDGEHSLKVSTSIQEWCGHAYMELKNKKKFDVRIDSYFEGESENDIELEKNYLEDDFWTMIRLNPDKLPEGKVEVIPSFFYLRLTHQELKAYDCEITTADSEYNTTYILHYPDLDRDLEITYQSTFPYTIMSWKETYASGWGAERQDLTTTGTLKESIRVDYWNKNSVADSTYRQQLGLD